MERRGSWNSRNRTIIMRLMLLVSLAMAQALSAAEVSYEIRVEKPTTGLVDVTMRIRNIASSFVDVAMPAWEPGFYQLQNHIKNVQQLYAEGASGEQLNARQVGTNDWRIWPRNGSVDLHYKVYIPAWRMDDVHASLSTPGILMYLIGEAPYPAAGELTLSLKVPKGWKVATGLQRVKTGVYKAPDYDTLIDAPIEAAAELDQFSFNDHGATYEIVIRNPHNYDRENFSKEIQHIVSEYAQMMGGVPFDRYVFLFNGQNQRGGGLEHLNSTTIGFKRYDDTASEDYRRLRFLIAHEFFHLWNIKRIRPEIYGPFDYSKPQHSRNLYISEGMTDYFAYVGIARQGLWTREVFYEELAKVIERHQSAPGRLITSVEDISWNFWNRSDNAEHTGISFYTKGSLIGLLLDMEIRRRTENNKSLDDVFRLLYSRNGLPKQGFAEDGGFKSAVQEVTVQGRGDSNYDAFFASYVSGLEELDYVNALAVVGLTLEIEDKDAKPGLQMDTKVEDGQFVVTGLEFGGAAYEAGVMKNDILLALDGERPRESTWKSRLSGMKTGDKVELMLMRGDRIVRLNLKLAEEHEKTYKISEIADASEQQLAWRAQWLQPYAEPMDSLLEDQGKSKDEQQKGTN